MSERGGKLVTAGEPTVVAKPLLNPFVVGGQGDRRLSDSAGTNQCNRLQVVCRAYDVFDQVVASEDLQGWGR